MNKCSVCGTRVHRGYSQLADEDSDKVWLDSDGLECSSVPEFHDHDVEEQS